MLGYGGGESIGGDGGSGVYNGRAEPVLVSLSDSYSENEEISVCDSGPSSSPAYTTTDYLSTGYCPNGNVCYFVLRRTFYSKRCFKNNCCFSA